MKATLLLLVAVALFVLGARFFVKFLRITVFDVAPMPGAKKFTASDVVHHLTMRPGFAHQAAVVSGGTTVIGATLGASWGWAPIYLWIVAGTLIIGSIFAIGSSWLVREFPDHGATEVTARFLGPTAPVPLLGLLAVALLILIPMLAIMIGDLLSTYSSGAAAFLLILPAAAVIGALQRRESSIALLVALNLFVFIVVLGGAVPVRIFGDIGFSTDQISFQLNARAVWAVLLLFTAAIACRIPQASLAQPMGTLALVGMIVVLLTLMLAIVMVGPKVAAPAHNDAPGLPSVFPWLCVVATGGALSFFHGLTTDEGLGRHGDAVAQHFAFGRGLLDATLAIVVLLIAVSVSVDGEAWKEMHAEWNADKPLHLWVAGFVLAGAELLGTMGLPRETMSGAIVLMIAALGVVTLETALRTLHYLAGEGISRSPFAAITPRTQWLTTFGGVALITLFAHTMSGGTYVLPVLGTASLFFTATLLAVITIAVADIGRAWWPIAIPTVVLGSVAISANVVTLWRAIQDQQPLVVGLGLLVLSLGLWSIAQAIRSMATVLQSRHVARTLF